MVEVPLLAMIFLFAVFAYLGFMARMLRNLTPAGRRDRALDRAVPVWEVWVGSDGPQYEMIEPGLGYNTLVIIRKVKRANGRQQVLQRIRIAEIHSDDPPEKLLAAVDRANTLIQTITLTGAS